MAREIRTFDVSTPAGTTADAPLVTDLSFPPRQVLGINVRVPPGPSGALGFAVACSGTPVIPYQSGQWIITDNEVIDWSMDNYPDSGSWQLISYNTGTLPHTVYLRFLLDVVGAAVQPATLNTTVGLLSSFGAADLAALTPPPLPAGG